LNVRKKRRAEIDENQQIEGGAWCQKRGGSITQVAGLWSTS
jgi:hypothetical protein